ncbi:TRAP transporter small permease [Candidatus Latescibacterota bacterium]
MKNTVIKSLEKIDRAVEIFIAVIFSLMVIVGAMQVFSRYVLRDSLSWSEEFQKFSHIWLIFIAIPLAYKRNSHIGMNIVLDKLPVLAQKTLLILTDVMWFGLGLIMVIYTSSIMKVAKLQTSPGLGLRMDAVYFCIVIGGCYLCLVALQKLYEHFTFSTTYAKLPTPLQSSTPSPLPKGDAI